MAFLRRKWTPTEADEWTKEDWITIIISPIAYVLIMIGTALSFLLLWIGFVILAVGLVTVIFMHWIIDPKLKEISEEYEKKQAEYLKDLEEKVRWRGSS